MIIGRENSRVHPPPPPPPPPWWPHEQEARRALKKFTLCRGFTGGKFTKTERRGGCRGCRGERGRRGSAFQQRRLLFPRPCPGEERLPVGMETAERKGEEGGQSLEYTLCIPLPRGKMRWRLVCRGRHGRERRRTAPLEVAVVLACPLTGRPLHRFEIRGYFAVDYY
jgi:hypothetical protein